MFTQDKSIQRRLKEISRSETNYNTTRKKKRALMLIMVL